ncbi:MAG: DegT/DnrJ/EryC1/StrS family aminotransferase [Verrucomicrobiota bacterium]
MHAVKSRIEDLAIFGGPPAFGEELHVGRPNVGQREAFLERVNDLLDRRWLTNDGPYLKQLEQRISQLVEVRHCVAVCNATVGLEIAIKAAGLAGEVIIPSFTFIATAHALEWQQITPVFCDINPVTHNLDPSRVERLITERTTGIIGVHLWGRPSDVEALQDIASRHKLKLLFDAAHAFGCSYNGQMIGNLGNAEVFSFHATKVLNTFEGGAVVTNDDELAAKIRLMRNFGFAGYDIVSSLGTNGKMSEVSAAMGLTSLESFKEFVATNYRNYKEYRQQLAEVPGVSVLAYDQDEKRNYHYIVLEIDEGALGITRDQLDDILWAENVLTRRYFYPGCHRMEPYRTRCAQASLSLPETEKLAARVLCLPTGTAVGSDEITAICDIIKFVADQGSAVKERMLKQPLRHHPLKK